jgi:hypothetical protein
MKVKLLDSLVDLPSGGVIMSLAEAIRQLGGKLVISPNSAKQLIGKELNYYTDEAENFVIELKESS